MNVLGPRVSKFPSMQGLRVLKFSYSYISLLCYRAHYDAMSPKHASVSLFKRKGVGLGRYTYMLKLLGAGLTSCRALAELAELEWLSWPWLEWRHFSCWASYLAPWYVWCVSVLSLTGGNGGRRKGAIRWPLVETVSIIIVA